MKITIEHSPKADFVLNVSLNGKLVEEVQPGRTRIYTGQLQVAVAPGAKYEPVVESPPKDAA